MKLLPGLIPVLCISLAFSQEHGRFPLQAFYSSQYQVESPTWDIVQSGQGLMYVAASQALLEYDGASWRSISLPGYPTVRSLGADPKSGIVYIGANNTIGCLRPNRFGWMEYDSLTHLLSDSDRHFQDVWQTQVIGDSVFFMSEKQLMLLHKGAFQVFPAGKFGLYRGFALNGAYYAYDFEKGLVKLGSRGWELVRTDLDPGLLIYALLPGPDGSLMALVERLGI
ncbi:MAG: hypothetical protein EAZ89_12100, partial [Bacteroidetes bacterium]